MKKKILNQPEKQLALQTGARGGRRDQLPLRNTGGSEGVAAGLEDTLLDLWAGGGTVGPGPGRNGIWNSRAQRCTELGPRGKDELRLTPHK